MSTAFLLWVIIGLLIVIFMGVLEKAAGVFSFMILVVLVVACLVLDYLDIRWANLFTASVPVILFLVAASVVLWLIDTIFKYPMEWLRNIQSKKLEKIKSEVESFLQETRIKVQVIYSPLTVKRRSDGNKQVYTSLFDMNLESAHSMLVVRATNMFISYNYIAKSPLINKREFDISLAGHILNLEPFLLENLTTGQFELHSAVSSNLFDKGKVEVIDHTPEDVLNPSNVLSFSEKNKLYSFFVYRFTEWDTDKIKANYTDRVVEIIKKHGSILGKCLPIYKILESKHKDFCQVKFFHHTFDEHSFKNPIAHIVVKDDFFESKEYDILKPFLSKDIPRI